MLPKSPSLRLSFLLFALSPALLPAQADKGMNLLSKGNPAAAEAAFRADLDNPKEAPLAMYGLSLVFADAKFERRQLDTAFVYIENCDKAYRKMPPDLKSRIVKKLTATMIADQRKAVIELAFARAKEQATVQSYEFFLENFPKPAAKLKRAALAERNTLVFQQAKATGQLGEMQAMLDRYGSSLAADTPNLLEEAQRTLFQFFIHEKGWDALPEFKKAYPENVVSKDTLQTRFQQALDAPDPMALETFINKYPGNSVFVFLATDSLAARLVLSGSPAACKKFLVKNPQHPQSQLIWKRMYEQVNTGATDPARLEQFLKDNPAYPFPDEVKRDIAYLKANQVRIEAEAFLKQSEPEPGFRFLRSHGQSEYIESVQNHLADLLLKRDAAQSATAKYIRDFIVLCPDHKSVTPLWKHLYTGVQKTATEPATLERFLSDHPDYPFKNEVQADIQQLIKNRESIEIEAFLQNPNLERGFYLLEQYPKNPKKNAVLQKMTDLLTSMPRPNKRDLERLLEKVPNAGDAQRIVLLKQLYNIISKDFNIDAIIEFEGKYPDFPDKKRITEDKKRADWREITAGAYTDAKRNLYEECIKQNAPADIALDALKAMVNHQLMAGQYQEAQEIVRTFDKYFGKSNASYNQYRSIILTSTESVNRRPFDTKINTIKNEYAPVLTADGQSLYFCRRNNTEDIYECHLDSLGHWSEPVLTEQWATSGNHEASESISADGNTFFLFKNGYFFTSKKTSQGWDAPVKMPAPFNTFLWQADLRISADGKAMLFAAGPSISSPDIYVSLMQTDGKWGIPFSLGPGINTEEVDRSPFLHPDGKTLYFSSEGHSGVGGLDIFKTERLDSTWTRWSTPVNLGPAFNTPGNERDFRVSTDGRRAFYTTSSVSGNLDIWLCDLPAQFRPDKVATLTGKVTDTKDVPLDAEILWEDLSTGQIIQITRSNPATGEFFAVLPERKRYGYTARKPGYFPQSGNVDMRTELTEVRLPQPIRLATIENMRTDDISLPLNNLFFETAKYELQPESFPELNRLADLIQSEGLRIEIQGHTDNVGNDAGNQTLSENRAKSVRTYLVGRGCNAGNITAKGFGESKPKASNDTEEGRAQNRRVEIRIVR